MTLYIPIGPPGCGKTTHAGWVFESRGHSVAQMLRTGYVCPDEYREILTEDRADQTENRLVFEICHKIAQKRCERGLDVYFDATNLTMEALSPLKTMQGDKHIFLWRPNPEVYSRRNKNRTHVVPDVPMERMLRRHDSMWEKREVLPKWAHVEILG